MTEDPSFKRRTSERPVGAFPQKRFQRMHARKRCSQGSNASEAIGCSLYDMPNVRTPSKIVPFDRER